MGSPWPYLPAVALNMTLYWVALFRPGILPTTILWTLGALLATVRITPDLTAWHALPMWVVYGAIAALTAWGFRAAVAGRPLFRDEIQEG